MTIDMIEVRNDVVANLMDGVHAFENLTIGEVGLGLVGVGLGLGVIKVYKDWRKKRGYRMVLRERGDKINSLLTTIINDGLFEAELGGKISSQELDRLYAEMASKLNLPDLVPKKRLARIVKSELKRRKHTGVNKGVPNIPGEKPAVIKQRFTERVGTFATKFWRAA